MAATLTATVVTGQFANKTRGPDNWWTGRFAD